MKIFPMMDVWLHALSSELAAVVTVAGALITAGVFAAAIVISGAGAVV